MRGPTLNGPVFSSTSKCLFFHLREKSLFFHLKMSSSKCLFFHLKMSFEVAFVLRYTSCVFNRHSRCLKLEAASWKLQMLDAGCSKLGAGGWKLEAGSCMLKAGCWKQETGGLVSHLFLFDQPHTALMGRKLFIVSCAEEDGLSYVYFPATGSYHAWIKLTVKHVIQ